MTNSSPTFNLSEQKTLFGHPTGLYTLFFAEMWERFSYYGMRALLMFYMIKGFLGFGDKEANAVYGAYVALVYLTPFFGGMIADRWLGSRAAVVIGGILMALGHLLMTIEVEFWFFTALAFLIVGNGFFKPNISTIVGRLYPDGSPKRDSGFTLFYIGINLGAAMAPLLCGYVGEVFGWHYGFGLATAGMLIGIAVFVAPTRLTQIMILITALISAYMLFFDIKADGLAMSSNFFVAIVLIISAFCALMALNRGGLSKELGAPPIAEKYMTYLQRTLIGTLLIIPIIVLFVSGFSVIPGIDKGVTLVSHSFIENLNGSSSPLIRGLATFVEEGSRPAGLVLLAAFFGGFGYLAMQALKMNAIERHRMYVVFVLTFFSLLFWAFFEQSGSSLNNFADRNVDRVSESRLVTDSDIGKTQKFRLVAPGSNELVKDLAPLSQEFLGQINDADISHLIKKAITHIEMSKPESKRMTQNKLTETINTVLNESRLTMSTLTYLREYAKSKDAQSEDTFIEWTFHQDNVGKLGLGGIETPASVYQSVNPIFIIIFGLIFTALWQLLAIKGLEPNTPVKFALGILQLGLGFYMLYIGAQSADSDGMVGVYWLILMYLLLTTGELCLSPVGLSMVTKMAPKHLVSTVMGAWFLATAMSGFIAAIIAQFAAVNTGDSNLIPVPSETVHIYGDVFKLVAYMALASGVLCLLLSPILKKWMHEETTN